MFWQVLAVLVIVVHFAYLLFIPLGGFLAWKWPRIIPFHLVAIAIGLISVTVHFDCPLTNVEQAFERRAGEHPHGAFVDRYIDGHLVPHGYDFVYQLVIVGAIVVSYAVMLRRRARRVPSPSPS
jgi:hypothetical protein